MDLRNEAFVEYADGTKIVRVMDDPKRSPEQSAQISVYRRERWIVLAEYAACSVSERADRETECARLRSRLGQLNLKLYQLTKNPIYDN